MNIFNLVACVSAFLCVPVFGQPVPSNRNDPGIAQEVTVFALTDQTLIEGLSELSRNPEVQLHLGIEEAARDRLNDSIDRSVRFSLRLERSTVQEILNALCHSDARYTWSTDGSTINVYPAARDRDKSLLDLDIARITLNEIPDADQALTPLFKLFPGEQVAYSHVGPDYPYREPWTVTFEDLTVRQFINRINEHLGPRSAWIWQGGKDGRIFNFIRGGFRRSSSNPPGPPAGSYCNSFLAQLRLQGSAVLVNGTDVQYSGSAYDVTTSINSADGSPVSAGRTVARDRSITPKIPTTLVDINGVGSGLLANDTGGAILGYRIDYYAGAEPAAHGGFINIMSVSGCSPANSSCPGDSSVQ